MNVVHPFLFECEPNSNVFCHGMVPNCWMVQRYDLYCVVLYLIIVLSWLLFNPKPSFIHILAIFASLHHLKTYYKTSHTMWGNPLATTMTMESQSCALGKVVVRLLFAFKMSWLFTPILSLNILYRIKYLCLPNSFSIFTIPCVHQICFKLCIIHVITCNCFCYMLSIALALESIWKLYLSKYMGTPWLWMDKGSDHWSPPPLPAPLNVVWRVLVHKWVVLWTLLVSN